MEGMSGELTAPPGALRGDMEPGWFGVGGSWVFPEKCPTRGVGAMPRGSSALSH